MQAAAAAATAIGPIWQAKEQHEEAIHLNNELHLKSIQVSQAHHKEELKLNEVLHTRECALETELHCSQMSHDRDIARREGIRDVWSQRNQLIQTLMIVDTLMFACAYAICVQGDPSPITPSWLVILYAVSQGVSLSFLFASIWFSLKLQTRMSHYDMHNSGVVYTCGRRHRNFNEYYSCHCSSLRNWAFSCFYLGTAATICDAALFALMKLKWDYGNLAGGVVFVVVGAFAMAMPLIGKVLWPTATSSTSHHRHQSRTLYPSHWAEEEVKNQVRGVAGTELGGTTTPEGDNKLEENSVRAVGDERGDVHNPSVVAMMNFRSEVEGGGGEDEGEGADMGGLGADAEEMQQTLQRASRIAMREEQGIVRVERE